MPQLLVVLSRMETIEAVAAYSTEKIVGPEAKGGIDCRIVVYDGKEKIPIGLARIVFQRGRKVIVQDATNAAGQVWFRDIQPGSYMLTAWFVGYQMFTDSILINKDQTTFTINLRQKESQSQGVEVVGQRELGVSNIDMKTGNQTFESETYHPPPTTQMTNLIQENTHRGGKGTHK